MFYVICWGCTGLAWLGVLLDMSWLTKVELYGNLIMIGYAIRMSVEVLSK